MRLYLILFLVSISSLVLAQEEGSQQLIVRKIILEGNKKTRDFVVLRELDIKVGDTLKENEIKKVLHFNKMRILNSKLFSTVDYEVRNRNGDSLDVVFKMKELFYWAAHPYVILADRNFNVWWSQMGRKLNRLNIGADINRKNFRGRNEDIGGEIQVGFNKHVYLYYNNPFIDKSLKHGMRLVASYNTGREVHAQTDSNKQVFYRNETTNPYRWYRVEASHLYRPAYASNHELRLGFNHFAVSDSLLFEQPDYLGGRDKLSYFELMYQYRYDITDDRNYPESGWEIQAIATKKGLGIFNELNQTTLYTHIAKYNKWTNRLSTALHLRARASFPDRQPFFNYRGLGFKNDFVRGYEYYLMDGSHYGLLRADVRYKILDFPFRQKILPLLQFVPIKVFAKAYNDIGYAKSENMGNSYLNNMLLHGYGAGIDIVLSYYATFRVEYSFNQLGENGLFLHGRKE